MKIARAINDLHGMLADGQAGRTALVPTMGALHDGHLALIRRAKGLADSVVVSIYVNPLQFGPNEDFDAYPRAFEADCDASEAAGADILFHPDTLYPNGDPMVQMRVGTMADCLCGASRPGHFDGVATVVAILFNAVQPDVAVFGEKDWQQLAILRRMVADFALPIEMVGVETVREQDGLAMSSRNRYLSESDRARATALFAALQAMREKAAAGEHRASALRDAGMARLRDAGVAPEYLEIRDAATLEPLNEVGSRPARGFVAARIGKARLIDNIALNDTFAG